MHAHAGTGKTMIGVALARALLAEPTARVLVLAQTNHALDQFVEEIIDSGYPDGSVLRIGGRTKNPRMERLTLYALQATADRGGGGARGTLGIGQRERAFCLLRDASEARSELLERWDGVLALDVEEPAKTPLVFVESAIEVGSRPCNCCDSQSCAPELL